MPRPQIHVVHDGPLWSVKFEHEAKPRSHHGTQASAEYAARALAVQAEGDLVIHETDGSVRERKSFGGEVL
jgi:Uncharacterized protein conserved in bacteria (DUF2188)